MKLIRNTIKNIILLYSFFLYTIGYSQNDSVKIDHLRDISTKVTVNTFSIKQVDAIDLLVDLLNLDSLKNKYTNARKTDRTSLSILPVVGYTLQTRFAVGIAANAAFYIDSHSKLSVISMSPSYTQNSQIIIPITSNVWLFNNKYNFLGDWKFYKYPQYTYGLGGHTSIAKADLLSYYYITINQTLLRSVVPNFFLGLGYNLDYHWNITEEGRPRGKITDYDRYGRTKKSISSGLSSHLLYDNRINTINPTQGWYSHLTFRYNTPLLGSDHTWESLVFDFRKYFNLSTRSHQIIAIWSYTWLTFNKKPPYLDLPSTGWDTYSNIGRGYIQGRFRGKNLLYIESEYRFGLTRNGLLGGVIFANGQAVSEWPKSNKFENFLPAVGTGIRIKINKYSNTNIAIDYGFGLYDGSNGIFVNLGEVF